MSEPRPTKPVWRFFRRTAGGPAIFEIYRIPANGRPLLEQDLTSYPERLLPDGTWTASAHDTALLQEKLKGDFDEECDEISADEVAQLVNKWLSTEWPGRRD